MTVWLNGTLLADADARISVFDHGLTVGDGVFETVKISGGVPFALTRHLGRLLVSAAGLGLPVPDLDLLRRDALVAVIMALGEWPAIDTACDVTMVPWPRNEHGALAGLKTTSYAENVLALGYARGRGGAE